MKILKSTPTNFIRQIIDKDLATGKHNHIHTRFSPEPNGYLHIGHAKAICLNFGIAEDYNGKCNLRFDDTNPVQENIKYVNSIKKDLQWLGFHWSNDVKYTSDYFYKLYQYAIELIQKGLAYVDELTHDEIREYRGTLKKIGKNSPYRDRKINDNLKLFQKMRYGEFKEGYACLRAKIDMSSPFIIMRDPVLYRIKYVEHYQLGTEWCIYPMYDFSHCISDALEGITHSLCTLEFQDNRRLYNWILNNITIDHHPQQYEFSRLNLAYTVMSKRKLKELVENNIVDNWDDPRMPTISGLRRRGYTPNSIREFCRRIGVTKQDNRVEMFLLESCIRDDLDKIAPRVMAVLNPVKVVIENMATGKEVLLNIGNHPNKPEMGIRKVPFSRELYIDRADFREEYNKDYKRLVLNKKVRLRNAYVIKANRIDKDSKGNIIAIYCTYYPDTLNKFPGAHKVKGVIHWVSALHGVSAEIRLYNNLFNVSSPDIEKDFLKKVNPFSLVKCEGIVEPVLIMSKPGTVYQFEREGYFCSDIYCHSKEHLVFNRTVSLKDTWIKIKM
ncbi:MAG: glutamine--tRNA ligase [Arsenophonus sp.]|nr:MAG: glutamine--tRNA ligase [Arsenophonus sp.]